MGCCTGLSQCKDDKIVSEKVAFFIVAVFWLTDLPEQGVISVMQDWMVSGSEGINFQSLCSGLTHIAEAEPGH